MSRGAGIIQRKLLDLMAENPDGRWNTRELCKLVYGVYETRKTWQGNPRANAQGEINTAGAKSAAISRALRTMMLPDGWRYDQCGTRLHFLYRTDAR
jgi:hypothetical protein